VTFLKGAAIALHGLVIFLTYLWRCNGAASFGTANEEGSAMQGAAVGLPVQWALK
jgi:hypothetical protein